MTLFAFMTGTFVVVCCIDLILAAFSFQKKSPTGNALGAACLGAFAVTACYIAGLFVADYFAYSVFTSLYFAGVDVMLVSLFRFVWQFTHGSAQEKIPFWLRALQLYIVVDLAVMAVNPFCEIAVSYVPVESEFAYYTYEMKPLYWMHLVFTYFMVVNILVQLVHRLILAPKIYRYPFLYCVLTVMAVVGLNAVYLYVPDLFGLQEMDYSLIGYSAAAYLFYWNCFRYSRHGLLTHFHSWIFKNIEQGIVLFDYDDRLILHNRKAEEILPEGIFSSELQIADFLKACGLKRGQEKDGLNYSFQAFVNGRSMRVEYSVQVDRQGRRLGRLFVFSAVTTQFDLLTGFRDWSDFKENADAMFPADGTKQVIAVCDINSLSDINRTYGRTYGDRAEQLLSELMLNEFPEGTAFTRSREAAIAAICTNLEVPAVEACVSRVRSQMMEDQNLGFPVQIQSSVVIRNEESIVATIRRALQSMRTKKLMDKTSIHSEMLRSLLQALEQCDSDTGAHVQRTQSSCEELGKRIGLSDQEMSNLALLSIMHDIGKIGIPLEILNKPGKLTDAEWKMLKTHVEKGYNIARTSQELSGIADMIRYHHERWDGRGYPDGLKEEQIPLLSRIIAVVDAYDAMTNDRSYRKALPEYAARNELRRCAGTQFDPRIVREFLAMLDEKAPLPGSDALAASMPEVRPEGIVAIPAKKEHRNVHVMAYSRYVLDSSNTIVEADERFETMTGYTSADVASHSLRQSDLIFAEDRDEYTAQVMQYRPAGPDIYLEHRLRRKDGSEMFVYCYGHIFYDSAEGEERSRIIIINADDPFGD